MMKNKKRWCFLTLKEQSLFFILPFKQKRLNLSRTIDNFGLDNYLISSLFMKYLVFVIGISRQSKQSFKIDIIKRKW